MRGRDRQSNEGLLFIPHWGCVDGQGGSRRSEHFLSSHVMGNSSFQHEPMLSADAYQKP